MRLGCRVGSVCAWRTKGNLALFCAIGAEMMLWADLNLCVVACASSLTAETFGTDVTMLDIEKISSVREGSFWAGHLRPAGGAGRADISSLAEESFVCYHSLVGAEVSWWALIEGFQARHSSQRRVETHRSLSGRL